MTTPFVIQSEAKDLVYIYVYTNHCVNEILRRSAPLNDNLMLTDISSPNINP